MKRFLAIILAGASLPACATDRPTLTTFIKNSLEESRSPEARARRAQRLGNVVEESLKENVSEGISLNRK